MELRANAGMPLHACRIYGPVKNRENWNDPVPPRPPILDTGAAVRPNDPGQVGQQRASIWRDMATRFMWGEGGAGTDLREG